MKVLALLHEPDSPSALLRFEPFAARLEAAGHSIARAVVPRSGPSRWRLFASAGRFDVVYLQRRLLQPWESALLRSHARRLVVDVDDAIWRRDHAPFESWTRRLRARSLLSRADVVLAGSRTLVEELRSIGIVAEHAPTPAPPPSRGRAKDASSPATLLWIGQPSTWRYAQALAPAWEQVRRELAEVRFVAVGSGRSEDGALPGVEHRRWSESAESAALAEADVGLAPLPDDPWTRGKCGARLLLFLANGIPAVASPVGAQRELADDAGGVLLASEPARFADAILELLRSPVRGRASGEQASARLGRERSAETLAPRFLQLLEGSGIPVAAGFQAPSAEPRVAGGGGRG